MNRFLSRREKGGGSHTRQKSRDNSADKKLRIPFTELSVFAASPNPLGKGELAYPETTHCELHTTTANSGPGRGLLQIRPLSGDGIISMFKTDPQKKIDKESANKVTTIRDRLAQHGYPDLEDEQINYALSSKHAEGDSEKAIEMLLLFQESVDGVVKPYDPNVLMLGAENREGVTCYLDALLYAMFSRLGSFEPMLYSKFEDEPRRRLSTLIRLWVNLLRTGKLIQTDVTKHLQEALAACGWEEAANLEQQDTSEAFSFITEKLELPLLTLKMDIFHTGKEDDKDDHKFVQERLLEVAVPDDAERERPIRLEDCLESYFNNQVEVVRRLERSNTRSSVKSARSPFFDKSSYEREWSEGASTHVEVSELPWSTPDTPTSCYAPGTPISPGARDRAPSIIRHRVIYDDEKEDKNYLERVDTPTSIRKGSIRKEVLMPAWQFFNLIPWYTQHSPSNDADVAAHFSKTRPVLGICLKRYAMTEDGRAMRKNTFIDIPLDIRLPHFIQDEVISEDGPLVGNFKLQLQSVICHRGNSVHSGHYISFIRGHQVADGEAGSARRLSNNTNPPVYAEDEWIKFDDLAPTRVQYVDIEKAMKDEMPYLLFYQVTPMHELHSLPEMDPPSYQDTGIGLTVSSPQSTEQSLKGPTEGYFDGANEPTVPATRSSSDADRVDEPRRSINLNEERRGSLAVTEVSMTSTASATITSAPATPIEETAGQRMSRAAARFTKSASKSRPSSQSGEGRLSLTLSRLNWRTSKEQLFSNKTEITKEKEIVPPPESTVTDGAPENQDSSAIDDSVLKTDDESTPTKVTRKDKKRNKSKGPAEMVDQDHQHTHHLRGRGKGKDKDKEKSKDIDRECRMM